MNFRSMKQTSHTGRSEKMYIELRFLPYIVISEGSHKSKSFLFINNLPTVF